MKKSSQPIDIAASYISSKIIVQPEVLIISGTGLGNLSGSIENPVSIPYDDIPGFPKTTVESHSGVLVSGMLSGKPVILMQGRFHLYEGYTSSQVAFPIWVMKQLGVKMMIITNASGGINLTYKEGTIMVIEDHVNLTGHNPLTGPNDDTLGLRFPDMIHAYDKDLIRIVEQVAEKTNVCICKGVYAGLPGPSLETPAEIRFLKTIGADSVGFSTIQEVIASVHASISVLGLSVITNINNPDNPEPATIEGVLRIAEKTAPILSSLITETIGAMHE